MNFHFSNLYVFSWCPTSYFYPHKVLFLTIVSFSVYGQIYVSMSQNGPDFEISDL